MLHWSLIAAMSLFAVRQRVWGDIRRYQAWRDVLDAFLARDPNRQEWHYYLPVNAAELREFKRITGHEWMGE